MLALASFRPLFLGVVAIAASACQNSAALETCDGARSYGIEVRVLNASTGQTIAAGAGGSVSEGAFVDSLAPRPGEAWADLRQDELVLAGALERPGTYAVTITRPGFQDWRARDVRVVRNACGVATVRLTARLSPTGS